MKNLEKKPAVPKFQSKPLSTNVFTKLKKVLGRRPDGKTWTIARFAEHLGFSDSLLGKINAGNIPLPNSVRMQIYYKFGCVIGPTCRLQDRKSGPYSAKTYKKHLLELEKGSREGDIKVMQALIEALYHAALESREETPLGFVAVTLSGSYYDWARNISKNLQIQEKTREFLFCRFTEKRIYCGLGLGYEDAKELVSEIIPDSE